LAGGFGRLGRRQRVGMNVDEREVPEDDLEGHAALGQPGDLACRLGGVRTLEVAVDDELSSAALAPNVIRDVDRG
jgi:hypothetical protein